jgi:hypothetical protein
MPTESFSILTFHDGPSQSLIAIVTTLLSHTKDGGTLKRDTDLIRDILLKIEDGQKMFNTLSSDEAPLLGISLETPMSREEADKLIYHLDLLDREGIIEIETRLVGGSYLIKGLTREGHDYLDSEKAKSSAASAGEEPREDRLIADEKRPELFILKPGVSGVSMDLKELFHRAKVWWKRKK